MPDTTASDCFPADDVTVILSPFFTPKSLESFSVITLKAMEVERFVDESVMKNFVIGIAANIWKNTWRKEKRRRKVVSTTEFDAEYMYEPAFGDTEQNGDPQDTYIREETRQIVIRAVDTLPDRYRIILLMYYSADMTTQEIADQLGMSKGTVTSRLMRARDKVRRNLEDNGYER